MTTEYRSKKEIAKELGLTDCALVCRLKRWRRAHPEIKIRAMNGLVHAGDLVRLLDAVGSGGRRNAVASEITRLSQSR